MAGTLCVYCTRTGHTKKIMEEIAQQLGAELVRITDGKAYRGVFGYCAAAVFALGKKLPPLLPAETKQDIAEYDRIIVGFPIWAETSCPVAKAFVKENAGKLRGSVYYVATHMSALPYDKPLAQLDELAGRRSSGTLSLQTRKHDPAAEIAAFVAALKE